jgi:hypothetical protein
VEKRKIYTVTEAGAKLIKTFPKQGYTNVVFNAYFYRNGKKLNSLENTAIANFSGLLRNYDKAENPDKVKIEFKNQDDNVLIWSKVYELNDSLDGIPKSLSGYAGLGEAEVNDLVQRKFSEMERSKELERLSAELTKATAMNEELQYQVLDMQASLDAKKQIEYYSSVIGMALPGLAKFFTGTPVGTAINFLSGTEEAASQSNAEKEKDPNQREAILELIQNFCAGLSNQELGTMYLLLSEIEKDKAVLKTILDLITQNNPSPQS